MEIRLQHELEMVEKISSWIIYLGAYLFVFLN